MDGGAAAESVRGVADSDGGRRQPGAGSSATGSASCKPFEEGGLSRLPRSERTSTQSQCHGEVSLWRGREGDYVEPPPERHRALGVWEARQPELHRGDPQSPQLRDMGRDHCPRERRCSLVAPSIRRLCQDAYHGRVREEEEQPEGFNRGTKLGNLEWDFQRPQLHDRRVREPEPRGSRAGSCLANQCGGAPDTAPSRTPGQERDGTREGRDGEADGTQQEPQGDVIEPPEEILQVLGDKQALLFSKHWQQQRKPYTKAWQNLVAYGRPLLMELACFEDSRLSEEVLRRYGPGSAIRASHWNGCDLETNQGVKIAKELVRRPQAVHIWISCECGPFCPLQRLNQKTEEQCEALRLKQAKALKQYAGAFEVAKYANKKGVQVHWELSERSEAWSLDIIKQVLSELGLKKTTCHGCCVGLRTADGKQALCKGWSIASKNPAIQHHLNLRCQRNHSHGECPGRNAVLSSRYTSMFVRKVVDCFEVQEGWSALIQELGPSDEYSLETSAPKGSPEAPGRPPDNHNETAYAANSRASAEAPAEPEGDAEDEELSPTERQRKQEILRKIQHLHRVTGHGSLSHS